MPDFGLGIDFPHDIVRVDSDLEIDPSDVFVEREVSYSFTLRDSRFRLFLTYWKGDRRAAAFEATLSQVLKSIVAIQLPQIPAH